MATSGKEKYVVGVDFGTAYSGYAYVSFKDYHRNTSMYHIAEWKENKHASKKAPSAILFDKRKDFVAFGYEAVRQYTDLLESEEDEHKEYYYFTDFKMVLHSQVVQSDTQIIDHTGKQMEASEVFSKTIKYFKGHVKKNIKTKQHITVQDDQLFFVLTIPAPGTDAAKKFIKDAATEAGIKSTQISIAVEPEVASMFCKELKFNSRDSQTTLAVGKKYMVIDLGGRYTDINVYQIQMDQQIQEVVPHCGIPYGGSSIGTEFQKLLAAIFGKDVMESLKYDQKEDFQNLCTEFEFKKRGVKPKSSTITFNLPCSLVQIVKKLRKMSVGDAIKRYQYNSEISCKELRLVISIRGVERLFDETIDSLVASIKKVLSNAILSDLKTVILVGGFSQDEFVHTAVRKELGKSMQIIIPEEAEIAVLRGALMFGIYEQEGTKTQTNKASSLKNKRPAFHTLAANKSGNDVYRRSRSQRGLLLIINFEFEDRPDERTGSTKDVTDLDDFFNNLGYKVEIKTDMTRDEVFECLHDVREKYLKADAEDYSSFFCVVMSHGDANGIQTLKGVIAPDEIVSCFDTNEIKPFEGKPKVFFFDMCRVKPKEVSGGSQVLSNSPESHLSNPKMDTLVVYATVAGDRSYSFVSKEWTGSFFIQAFLSVAGVSLSTDLESILRQVRQELKDNPEYGRIGGNKCMMSESGSILLKKIYL